jgi:Lipid A 3-O-deacylase (PagL)
MESLSNLDSTQPAHIWRDGVGEGFLKHSTMLEVKLTRGFGTEMWTSGQAHDLWLTQFQFGKMVSGVLAKGRWYSGNFEMNGQFLAGFQDQPDTDYFTGLGLGLRYHFATGCRLVPFLGLSAGVALTDIGEPDLGGVFQFHEQASVGLRYFLDKTSAINLEYGGMHISNAGISYPNRGVNVHLVSIGISRMF